MNACKPSMIGCVAAAVCLALVACRAAPDAPPEARATPPLHAGFMYWTATPVLLNDWSLVVCGVVEATHEVEHPLGRFTDPPGHLVEGTLRVERVLWQRPLGGSELRSLHALRSEGFEGLSTGARVIVFAAPYEGAHAVPSYTGTSSLMGFQVESCEEPIVREVERTARGQAPLEAILDDEDRRSLWLSFDPAGVASLAERRAAQSE